MFFCLIQKVTGALRGDLVSSSNNHIACFRLECQQCMRFLSKWRAAFKLHIQVKYTTRISNEPVFNSCRTNFLLYIWSNFYMDQNFLIRYCQLVLVLADSARNRCAFALDYGNHFLSFELYSNHFNTQINQSHSPLLKRSHYLYAFT